MNVAAWNWGVMMPEFTILGFSILISVLDIFLPKKTNRNVFAWVGLIGVVLAGFFIVLNFGHDVTQIMGGKFRLDAFGNLFKLIFLSGVALVFLMSVSILDTKEVEHRGEFYYLILTALLGAMMMASSTDMITLFIGLELLSLSSYILVGSAKRKRKTNESAFKYIVSGGIATAVTLYGMSFIYGLTGSTNLVDIQSGLNQAFNQGYDFMVYLAFVLVFVGLAFKLALVPYHMWAPDVYEGATTPVTAFLAVVSKAAGFAIVLRFFFTGFIALQDVTKSGADAYIFSAELTWFIGLVAVISMIAGNMLALRQRDVKRMMAYSSIAHAAYIMVPFVTVTYMFFETVTFYLIAYLLMTAGAFTVIMIVNRDQGTQDIRSFAGLYHRSPWLAAAMTVFLLSLAGLPVTAGFFGKVYIFMNALAGGGYVPAGVMILTTVISYYYYFGIVQQMYMRPGTTESPVTIPGPAAAVVIIALVGTVGFGVVPGVLIDFIHTVFPNFGEMFHPAAR